MVSPPVSRNKEDVEDVRREVQILHHLGGHPNITLLKGAYEDKYNVHLVMELCSGGELFDRIVSRGHYRCAAVPAGQPNRKPVREQHWVCLAELSPPKCSLLSCAVDARTGTDCR